MKQLGLLSGFLQPPVCLKEAALHLSFKEEKTASIKSEILIKKILQC